MAMTVGLADTGKTVNCVLLYLLIVVQSLFTTEIRTKTEIESSRT